MLKKLFSFLILMVFGFLGFTFAATGNCENKFSIIGPNIVRVNTLTKYKINPDYKDLVVSWEISKNNKVVFVRSDKQLSYTFKLPGKVDLKALVSYSGCNYTLSKSVKIYNKIILAVGIKNKFLSNISFNNSEIFLKQVNDITGDYLFNSADWIILNFGNFFDFLNKNSKNLAGKKIIILVPGFVDFYKKILIPYTKAYGKTTFYVVPSKKLLDLISQLYQSGKVDNSYMLSLGNVNSTFLPLSYFTSKLISAGLNVNIVGLVFVAILGLLIIAIFRQIIGFSAFGVYTPLIFAILIIIFGYKLTLLLFILSLISSILTALITKKIYILYSSKIALNYTIYSIVSLIVFAILFNYFSFDLSTLNVSVVLVFLLLPLLTKNLVKEETKVFSKAFVMFLLEFLLITGILLALFKWKFIQYIFIAYPDLLWLIVILNILVGRFTGLQLLEYIRFAPLIKKSLYEEE